MGAWWDWAIRLVVVQAVVLIAWWLWQARGAGFFEALNPISAFSVGTVIVQWGAILLLLVLLNRVLAGRARVGTPAPQAGDGPV